MYLCICRYLSVLLYFVVTKLFAGNKKFLIPDNLFQSCPVIWKFCTVHDWTTEMDVTDGTWFLGDLDVTLNIRQSCFIDRLVSWDLCMIMPSGEYHGTLLMISQHWFMSLGAWRHQAITWASVDQDLCRHMVLLGHNEVRWDLQGYTPLQKLPKSYGHGSKPQQYHKTTQHYPIKIPEVYKS